MPFASTLVPLWNRGAEWRRRIAMVEAAESFVYLSTFYLEHDAYGLAMLDALEAAQRRGVAVTLLIDDTLAVFGSYNFEDAAHDRLSEAMMASTDVRAVQPVREIFAELRRHPDNVRVERHWFRDLPVALRLRIIRYARFKWWM
ncbi:MAG: hypothetical protein OHK0011_25580 [Turneriella sp.]